MNQLHGFTFPASEVLVCDDCFESSEDTCANTGALKHNHRQIQRAYSNIHTLIPPLAASGKTEPSPKVQHTAHTHKHNIRV